MLYIFAVLLWLTSLVVMWCFTIWFAMPTENQEQEFSERLKSEIVPESLPLPKYEIGDWMK